ncbi:MAG: type IV pilus assembly protein PilM [Candidatus Omnitrophica bacterium]|nr:type IV pilus assembly protein PilM [Candidatus Omnitrophota bacterium]
MNLKNLFRKEYIIGLDIGSSSIKLAQFKETESGLFLVKADLREINHAPDDEAKEKEALSVLRYLFRGIDIKKSQVITAVNCSQTAIKKVTAPYMPKSELREGITLEAKSYFPFPVDKSIVDFEVLSDVVEKGIRKYEVAVGVCPLNTVNKYFSLLMKAGIKPASFVTSSYALQEFAAGLSSKPDDVRCFIDIGDLHTELIICKGQNLAFSRKIPVSGSDFTKAMTGTLISDKGRIQLSLEEAETIKKNIGIPSNTDTRIIDDKISSSQILAMLRAPAEHLVNEIDRCFSYYREEAVDSKISSVTIFGGGASLGGLIKFLEEGLGIKVKLGDAIETLKADKTALREKEKNVHRVELAVGAALSRAGGINLLPPEIKEETKRTIKRGTIEVIATAVIIISVLIFIGLKIKLDNFNKRISAAKLELSSLQPEIKQAEARRLAEMVLVNEPYWEDVFKELGSLIPGDIVIEEMSMSNRLIDIKGVVSSKDGQQVLSDFVISLEKGLFSSVKLVESKNLPDNTGVEFELKCWIDYE